MKILGILGIIITFVLMLLLLSFIICIFILKSAENENSKK
jgi:phage shock protein PspC (stress-responsive transcriptional regulator)